MSSGKIFATKAVLLFGSRCHARARKRLPGLFATFSRVIPGEQLSQGQEHERLYKSETLAGSDSQDQP